MEKKNVTEIQTQPVSQLISQADLLIDLLTYLMKDDTNLIENEINTEMDNG